MTEQMDQPYLKGYNKIQHCETLYVQYLIKNYQAHEKAEKYDPQPGEEKTAINRNRPRNNRDEGNSRQKC